ncbi:MAG: hypothetical protein ACLQOO_06420 [Terriglobia bacterium]
MRLRFFLTVAAVCLATVSASGSGRMYCHQKVLAPGATGGGVIRPHGFAVEVGPTTEDSDDADFGTCHATIRSPQGKTVFEHKDWGIEIDPITGKDVNGDGPPDAVLMSYSGGAHCCWTYHIISLGKQPGVIREFTTRAPASFEDLEGNGRIEILIRDGEFDEGFMLDHAFSVFPLLILRLNGTEFEDVGSKFWRVFEKEIQDKRSKLNRRTLQDFLQSNPSEVHDDLDYLATKSTILLIVLDYLYAGRAQEARKVLGELWPRGYQEHTWEEMLSGFCTGFRAELGVVNAPCQQASSGLIWVRSVGG